MLRKLHYLVAKGLSVFVPTCKASFLLNSFFLVTFLLSGFVSFSQRTEIPDVNFRAVLLDKYGITADSDNTILNSDVVAVDTLEIPNKSILSLVGVEAFTSLIYLWCSGNSLSTLDVSANTALTKLYCYRNSLTSLDVSTNTGLTKLACYGNSLSTLDVSANTALTDLYCSSNQLTALDVSANTALAELDCRSNQLTTLNVSVNTALTYLSCSGNQLTSLNVSVNTALTYLSCTNNQLRRLNVANGNNINFRHPYPATNAIPYGFIATSNQYLRCIQVDNVNYSTNNWPNKDRMAFYSEDCNAPIATTDIPDPNFEQKLIDLGYDSGEIDGIVNTAVIAGITSLDVNGRNTPDSDKITNLSGIEAFTALTELSCYNNQLTSLDVSENTALTYLGCFRNLLTTLNVSANTALTELSCRNNELTSLDVSANTALNFLWCNNNQLTSLNVANGNNTNFIDTINGGTIADSFKATGNPLLRCIQVDNVAYSTANWTNKSGIASYSEDCSSFVPPVLSTTNIPDPNFEQKLITLGYDSGEIDGVVYTDNISGITSLDVSNNFNTPNSEKITNLSGIQDFTTLTSLACYFNQLTSLDVSENTTLTGLLCFGNQLTSLDVSVNTSLTYLRCDGNQLTSLDVSENTALIVLDCGGNQLTSLDVSENTALINLDCYTNQLMSLDVSENTALTILRFEGNQLTSLDVSVNTALTILGCGGNQLTSLDVSESTALTKLFCYSNQLTSLDVSVNTALTILNCSNNELTSLNVANGNNANFIDNLNGGTTPITNSFKATGNPNLRCIQVDNVAYSTANWTNKSVIASYSEDCSSFVPPVLPSTTAIPDPNFEQKLISLGYDSGEIDGVVYTGNISGITSLDVSNNYNTPDSEKITNLSGIQDFTALTSLDCANNQLASLDISVNTALTTLNCRNNELTELNVSKNTALTYLDCWENSLTSLDVSTNTALTNLQCVANQLTELNVSANTALTRLECESNQLTSLDVSANTALTSLYCGTNSLTTLDVSANTALTFLSCYHNQLTNLDISTNTNTVLAILQAQGNLLTSLDVSTNTALTWLFCSDNSLTSLDVSTNTALTNLGCRNNELSELNVSKNTALTILDCRNNNLTSLNVANGNNDNFTLTYGDNRVANSFKATGNPNLRCIQVDNVAYSTANWTNKSVIASYSADCSSLSITTKSVSSITPTSATLWGNVPSDGGSAVTERGFVYSLLEPKIAVLRVGGTVVVPKVTSGTGTGNFSKNITGLTENTTYYYAAYATNSNGTVYGNIHKFSTISTATTNIPDPNFERKLISLGYDSGEIDGVVHTGNISGITSLNVSNRNTPDSEKITNLSGIEDFVALTSLQYSVKFSSSSSPII